MNEQELTALRQRAMRAAEAYGCLAGIEVADFLDSADDPPSSLHYLKIVVARRSASGELLSHESNVVLVTDDYGASVEQIVRQAAAELLESRCPADKARQGLWFYFAHGAARAAHAHQELPEAIVEPLDVNEDPHPRMGRMAERARPCSAGERSELYGQSAPAHGAAHATEASLK
jgi:hypothetical protein